MDSAVSWVSKNRRAIQQAHSRVSSLNAGHHYERFCQAVELVAQRLGSGWTADKAELALMSTGGKNPADDVVLRRLEDLVPSLRIEQLGIQR